ncbi:MAG: metallophosphoesterase family protein, partial [Thiobacillus sp.]
MPRAPIGLISDTHGLLRPEAVAALRGCAHIIHAGDIGSRSGESRGVLDTLARIAPLTVVRGNND